MRKKTVMTELRRLERMLRTHGPALTLLAGVDKLGRWLTGSPVWFFSRVTPDIYLGGQPARRIVDQLEDRGISGVVNLRLEYDYAEEVGGTRLEYLFLPVEDLDAPTLEQLQRGVHFIRRQIEHGGKVYIHCWEGLGRGPTMTAAYLVSEGALPEEAWKRIRKARPFIRPTAVQLERIDEFAAVLRQPLDQLGPSPEFGQASMGR